MHFAVLQTGLLNKLPTAQSRRVLYKTSLFRFLYNAVTAIVANLPTFFEPPIIRAERSHQYNKKKRDTANVCSVRAKIGNRKKS